MGEVVYLPSVPRPDDDPVPPPIEIKVYIYADGSCFDEDGKYLGQATFVTSVK